MAESLKITCLINNEVIFGPPVWGEHGLSYLVETPQTQVMLDTGHSPEVLAHNLKVLKKVRAGSEPAPTFDRLSHVVLSHGHYDHTGGFAHLLEGVPSFRLVASPRVFEPKYSTRTTPPHAIGFSLTQSQVAEKVEIIFQVEPLEIAEGITVTGRIPRQTEFEVGEPDLRCEQGGELVIDPFEDDRALVLEAAEGVVVLLGCAHSGLINTLYEVRRLFDRPILAVLGGCHLMPAGSERIARTVDALQRDFPDIQALRLNHCTGSKALFALHDAFGDRVRPFLAGETIEFEI
jgi:7,8-dihydropterin-6-yl-methyl-4-(beta-D-ribofuranosyl)aminobenzene 5'-phosphate synthase